MRVEVRLYGPFSLMSGKKAFPIESGEEAIPVEKFLFLLAGKLPRLKRTMNGADLDRFLKQRIMLVINGVPCSQRTRLLHDGDQVQVFTPIAGG